MKRLDLIIYQLVLSAILVSFGILFELKSVDNTPYVSTVFLTIPGSVILLGTAFSHIKKMNFKKFTIISLTLSILAEGLMVVIFKMYTAKLLFYIFLLVVLIISNVMSLMFYILYLRIAETKQKKVSEPQMQYSLTSQDD